jgi:hypothetical protein
MDPRAGMDDVEKRKFWTILKWIFERYDGMVGTGSI